MCDQQLYHFGVPMSQFIAPVNFMWRPPSKDNVDIEMETNNYSNISLMQERHETKLTNTSTCQLWVWIHAASLSDGLAALQSACSKQVIPGTFLLMLFCHSIFLFQFSINL